MMGKILCMIGMHKFHEYFFTPDWINMAFRGKKCARCGKGKYEIPMAD